MSDNPHILPWKREPSDGGFIEDAHGHLTAECSIDEDAAFIVLAANAHDALVAALDILDSLLSALPSDESMRAQGNEPGPLLVAGRSAVREARAALALAEPPEPTT